MNTLYEWIHLDYEIAKEHAKERTFIYHTFTVETIPESVIDKYSKTKKLIYYLYKTSS